MIRRRTVLQGALGAVALGLGPAGRAARPFPIYDSHAHFYTNDFARYPLDAASARNGAEAMTRKAMDFPQTPEVMFAAWDAAGVTRGCGVQYGSAYQTDNRYLLDIAAQHPDRITPIVMLDPLAAETPATIETLAHRNRIAGVRFRGLPGANGVHPWLSDVAAPVWETANRLGLAIVLLVQTRAAGEGGTAMRRLAETAARYPRVTVVLDHFGFSSTEGKPGFSPDYRALAQAPNICCKWSTLLIRRLEGEGLSPRGFLEQAAGIFGADRLVWGSDIGNSGGSMTDMVDIALASAAGLSAAQQRALFRDSAMRIFVPGGRLSAP